jgi:hypothetical protein
MSRLTRAPEPTRTGAPGWSQVFGFSCVLCPHPQLGRLLGVVYFCRMVDIAEILGSEKLIAINGRWPSFHDAEVLELTLSRGEMSGDNWVSPSITVRIHVFIELPNSKHTLTTIRFDNITEVNIQEFNHQNAILGLYISRSEDSSSNGRTIFAVEFRPAFGISAFFRCSAIEVVDASLCTPDGKVPA